MAISQKRYVDITSGVGGAAVAAERELIARLITGNQLAPMGAVMEFTSLDNVGLHFGTGSAEYAWAEKYFGFVSKSVTQPKKLSFARTATEAVAPQLISTITASPVVKFTGITDGSMVITMGGVSQTLTGLNFSSAVSLSDVASVIQTKINGFSAGGALWISATVSFTNGEFVLTGGQTGAAEMKYAENAVSGTAVAALIGWDISSLPVVSNGSDAESPEAAMTRIADISNNFGSFAFLTTLSTDEIGAVAKWTNAQNVLFLYSVPVTPTNYAEIQAAVNGMNGVCLTLEDTDSDAEFMPCAVLAATDYDRTNAAQNYMFQQFDGVPASVTTDRYADVYDLAKVNYYGETQSAGTRISFYQRGVLQGDIEDIGVYCNEMWLKDSIVVAMFNLLLAVGKVPANKSGAAQVTGVMMDSINRAIRNGTIIPTKELTPTQKAYITSITDDPEAWQIVYSNGYWLDVKITSGIQNGSTLYKVEYILIYSKGDSIKKVEGTHILI